MNSQMLLQDMIEIARGDKKLEETSSFSDSVIDSDTRRCIPKLLRWLFIQDFPGDTRIAKLDTSFSSKKIVQLMNQIPELQKYFEMKHGTLTFADGLSDEEASEMIQYVKQNYRPEVHF
jgi:hypothetical protein